MIVSTGFENGAILPLRARKEAAGARCGIAGEIHIAIWSRKTPLSFVLYHLGHAKERTNTLGFVGAGHTDDLKYMKAAEGW